MMEAQLGPVVAFTMMVSLALTANGGRLFLILSANCFSGSDTYSLTSQQKWQKDTTDLIQTLFTGDTPVADPKLLFTGSLACSTSNDNKNGGAKPSLDDADPNTFNCVASNRVCTSHPDR